LLAFSYISDAPMKRKLEEKTTFVMARDFWTKFK